MPGIEIIEERILCETRATVSRERVYLGRDGKRRSWSYIERRGSQQAVVIAARTRLTGSLVLIRQFRVPFGRSLVELPAGLVDPGETPAEAARRELAEETGYAGEVLAVGPAISSSAGLTTETFFMADMLVDEAPARAPHPEGSEDIEVVPVSPRSARETLQHWNEQGVLMDCKAFLLLRALADELG